MRQQLCHLYIYSHAQNLIYGSASQFYYLLRILSAVKAYRLNILYRWYSQINCL